MPHLSRKQWIMVGAGVALVLGFIIYKRRQAAAQQNQAGMTPTDSGYMGTDMGQEAADYASLAGTLQQQQATEEGDIQMLQQRLKNLTRRGGRRTSALQKEIRKLEKEIRNLRGGGRRHHKHHHHKRHHKRRKVGFHTGPFTWVMVRGKWVKHWPGQPTAGAGQHHPAGEAGYAIAPRSHQHRGGAHRSRTLGFS